MHELRSGSERALRQLRRSRHVFEPLLPRLRGASGRSRAARAEQDWEDLAAPIDFRNLVRRVPRTTRALWKESASRSRFCSRTSRVPRI